MKNENIKYTTDGRKVVIIGDKVQTAVTAVDGGIWSRKEGVMFAGNMDRVDEELKEIEEDKQRAAERSNMVGMTMGGGY